MTLWNDKLLIGVREIDDQHRRLIKAVDELMEASFQGKGKDAIEKTLNFAVAYTKEHFAAEEKLFEQSGYPLAFAHKQMHAGFITSLSALQSDFAREGATSGLSIKLNKSLVDWLVKHITAEDRKFADFMAKK